MNKDEAIQVIRNNFPTGRHQLCEALETLIPELKESEDERIRKEILDFVRSFWADHKEKLPQIGRWVTYLEKQGEQKPTWSEEDEKAINDIMWIIEAYRKNGFNETHIQMADSSEIWLKSLKPQPHWRPSEEQMAYLKKVYESYYFCDGERCALESLYNDLKKL